MAEVASAYVSLLPSAKGFGSKLQGQIGGEVNSAGKKVGLGFGKAIAASAGGLIAAIGVKDFLSSSIAEARESQKVGALTAQVIKSTGAAAGVSAKQVGDLATAISNKVGIDDEAIQSGENLLLTFKNIKGTGGVFKDATQSTVDMASALAAASGGAVDFRSSATLIGKALNDPIKGLTALQRVGVTFTQGQKDQIAALVKSGQTMQAQKIILTELKSEFGGAAAAQATAGEKASVAFKNLQEQIGLALLPVIDKVANALTTTIIPAISRFITQMQTGVGAGGALASAIGSIARNFGTIAPALAVVIAGLAAYKVAMAASAVVSAIQAAGTEAATGATWSLNAALRANPIGLVVTALTALGVGLVIAYKKSETFRNIVNAAWSAIKTATSAVFGFLSTFIPATIRTIATVIRTYVTVYKTVFTTAFNAIRTVVSTVMGWLKPFVSSAVKVVGAVIRTEVAAYRAVFTASFNAIRAVVSAVMGAVKSVISGAVNAARASFNWFASLPAKFHAWFTGAVNGAKSALSSLVGFVRSIPGRLMAALGDLASLFFAKGAALIDGLINGIKSRIGAVGSAIAGIASKIKGFLPGSPVKEGPLTSWNNGGAGKRLIGGLADGIEKATPDVEKATGDLAKKLHDQLEKRIDAIKQKVKDLKDTLSGLKSAVGGFDLRSTLGVNPANPTAAGVRDNLSGFAASVRQAGGEWTKRLQSMAASMIRQATAIDQTNRAIATEQTRHDALSATLDDQRQALESLRQTMDQFGQSVAANFTPNTFGQSVTTSTVGPDGTSVDTTVSGLDLFTQSLEDSTARATAMTAALSALAGKLDPTTFSTLAQSGDLVTAQQLAALSPAALQQVNTLIAANQAATANLAALATKTVFGDQQLKAQAAYDKTNAQLATSNTKLQALNDANERRTQALLAKQERLIDVIQNQEQATRDAIRSAIASIPRQIDHATR